MIRKLTIIVCALITLFVFVGLWLPTQQRVERSIVVARPLPTVYAVLNGYRHFLAWSPWVQRDPGAEYFISGPAQGEGAGISWVGDPRLVGTGRLEIIASEPARRIDMRLDFGPQGAARTYFELEPTGSSTVVTWGLLTHVSSGHGLLRGLLGRYLGILLEAWAGPYFEQGLVRFKEYAETLPAASFADAAIEIIEVVPVPVILAVGVTDPGASEASAELAEAFARISTFLAAHDLQMAGEPMAITRARGESGYRFDAAVPVKGNLPPLEGDGRLRHGMSPGGRAARIVHRGSYERIQQSYDKLLAYMAAYGLAAGDVSWEHYVEDPAATDSGQAVTHIYIKLQ